MSYFAKHNIDQTYHPYPLHFVYHIYVFWSTQIILSSHLFRIHIWDKEWVRFYRISLLFVGHDHHTNISCNVDRKLGHVCCKIHIQCSLVQEFDMKPKSKTFIYKAMRILVLHYFINYILRRQQLQHTVTVGCIFQKYTPFRYKRDNLCIWPFYDPFWYFLCQLHEYLSQILGTYSYFEVLNMSKSQLVQKL